MKPCPNEHNFPPSVQSIYLNDKNQHREKLLRIPGIRTSLYFAVAAFLDSRTLHVVMENKEHTNIQHHL